MLAVYVMLLISAITLEMAKHVCYRTEATVEQSTLIYPSELLHVIFTAQAV